MNQYFKDFPSAEYTLPSGTKFTSRDLSIRFRPVSSLANKILTTYSYQTKDGERPDMIAHRYYDHADFAWLVMLSGELYHYLGDFALTEQQLVAHIEKSYGIPIQTAMTTPHHYIDLDGDVIDRVDASTEWVSIYEHEFNLNESKRIIKLISKDYLPQIVAEMEQFFRTVKKGM
jgi:hypothetical protein